MLVRKPVGKGLPDPLEMGADQKKMKQVVCYKVGNQGRPLDLDEKRERLTCFSGWCCLKVPREYLLVLGA